MDLGGVDLAKMEAVVGLLARHQPGDELVEQPTQRWLVYIDRLAFGGITRSPCDVVKLGGIEHGHRVIPFPVTEDRLVLPLREQGYERRQRRRRLAS